MPRIQNMLIAWAVVGVVAESGSAKERHFEQVRVLLISRTAKCTSCHTNEKAEQLNAYGRRLSELPKEDSMADRIAALEAEPEVGTGEAVREQKRKDRDIDQDGVENWVEVLLGSSPADGKEKPEARKAERIREVVNCTMCHTATGLGGEGLAANPHNELGKLLATTYQAGGSGRARPTGEEAVRTAAERLPILSRLVKNKAKKPKGSLATYWERIRMYVGTFDSKAGPSTEALKAFRKDVRLQRRSKTREANRGLGTKAHPLDGFLLDGKGLD